MDNNKWLAFLGGAQNAHLAEIRSKISQARFLAFVAVLFGTVNVVSGQWAGALWMAIVAAFAGFLWWSTSTRYREADAAYTVIRAAIVENLSDPWERD